MYPASFSYSSPTSLDDALAVLAEHGEDAKLLAGGHSLLPLMKLRFAQPRYLVDLRRIADLSGIDRSAGELKIGAMTTYAALAASDLVRTLVPMLADAAAHIGDPQVRNRGTIGGSLAHADPAADLPTVMLAAEARMAVVGRRGRRVVPAHEFFVGMLTTALAPDEVLAEILIPLADAREGSAYAKCPHPASRFALVGVAASIRLAANGTVERARIAVGGMGPMAVRVAGAEAALMGRMPTADVRHAAAALVAAAVDPQEDLQGTVAYKRNLALVYGERALASAVHRAGG